MKTNQPSVENTSHRAILKNRSKSYIVTTDITVETDTKRCRQCKQFKPLYTGFHRRGAGFQNICKKCRLENSREVNKNKIQEAVSVRVVKLETKLRKIASNFADTAEQAEEIFSQINEYLLTHMRHGDADSRYLGTASLTAKNMIARERTYRIYVGSDETLTGYAETLQPDQSMSLEDEFIHRQHLEEIMGVIKGLSPENQKVIKMLYSGMRPVDIARELGVTRAAISIRLDRVEAKFRQAGIQPA